MAEASDKPNPWVIWPLLAVFLVVTGYIQLTPKLESTRPAGDIKALEGREENQPVRARLWEDPLSAVAAGVPAEAKDQPPESPALFRLLGDVLDPAHKSKPAPVDRSFRSMQTSIDATLDELGPGNKLRDSTEILVLFAMIDGGPYPDDVENRRRTRVAVLSALGAEKFTPHDADHLDYFVLRGQGRRAYVPFECFEPPSAEGNTGAENDAERRIVLLLWLNESAIGGQYLRCMTELSSELDCVLVKYFQAKDICKGRYPTVTFRVLGPSNSDVLQSMAEEAGQHKGQKTLVGRIYSPDSTAESARGNLVINDLGGIPLESVIGSDRELAGALARELHLRNACAANPANHVAIIAEWDTLYGQDIFRVFDEVLPGCTLCGPQSNLDGKGISIQHFTYFQGIDGRLPGENRKEESGPEREKDSAIWKEPMPGRPGTSVPAVGYPRIDYLRRTVDELKRTNIDWKAIGVVGSDVYDKILLIRILRYYFPGTILFTTDLDARLLDPAEYPSTHNLLIASHFGLELRKELQRDVAPFRSVYQTSEFFATLRAIRDTRDAQACQATGIPVVMTLDGGQQIILDPVPVVFEVGRTGPFPLEFRRADDQAISIEATAHPDYFARSFWPFRPFDWRGALWLALLIVFALAVFFPVFRWSWDPAPSNAGLKRLFRWILWLGIVSALLLSIAVWDHLKPAGEPLRMFDGVSTWPSEFLRLFAAFFAAGSIVRGLQHLEDSEKEMKPFFAEQSTIWSAHDRDGQFWARCRRVSLMALCYLAFAMFLSLFTEQPHRPVRGSLSDKIDFVLLLLSVFTTISLLFFVVDATLRSESLVRKLRDVESEELSPDKHTKWAQTLGFVHSSGDNPPISALAGSAVSRFLGIKLIAKLTKDVGPLIYFPAVALVLLFLSRNRAFDNWDWPPLLVVIFTVGSMTVVACGVSLRITADRARRDAIKKLDEALVEARQNAHGQHDDPMTRAIKAAMSEVKSVDEGAYSSIYENPVIRAVLIPLAGLAGLVPLFGQMLGIDL
jgi:hypothetical protein